MWTPTTEINLIEMIDNAEWMMDPAAKRLWDRIKIKPTKWQLSPWGDAGGGFWVVALIGHECVYYNDIEDGFNISGYDVIGFINDYYCDQPDLSSFMRSYSETLREDLKGNA